MKKYDDLENHLITILNENTDMDLLTKIYICKSILLQLQLLAQTLLSQKQETLSSDEIE